MVKKWLKYIAYLGILQLLEYTFLLLPLEQQKKPTTQRQGPLRLPKPLCGKGRLGSMHLKHNSRYSLPMDDNEIKAETGTYKWREEALPWKAWGSWFSWGSPVGLSIFLCSLLLSIGVFLLLLHKAGLLR